MVTIFTLAKEKISDWPKSGPVETGPTGPVATPLRERLSPPPNGQIAFLQNYWRTIEATQRGFESSNSTLRIFFRKIIKS